MNPVDNTHRASTLTDVLQAIQDAFKEAGEKVVFQVGSNYLENFGVGSRDEKVIFVPEKGPGAIGDPIEIGNAASQYHSCDVYVRAPAGLTDTTRFQPLYELNDKLIGAIRFACSGRLELGSVSDESPLKTDSLGCSLAYSFVYRRDIPNWSALRHRTFTGDTQPKSNAKRAPVKINVTVKPSE